MRYRRLGASDLMVPEISLGTWNYGAGVAREQAVACIGRAFDLGINFFDTANVYGFGAAETLLGEALSGRPRDSYLLGTKAYLPMEDGEYGLSRAQIEKQLDASLRRLRTDFVDLYQCHRYDEETPLEETMAALTDAVRAGKIRQIGFSNWPAERIRDALALTGYAPFVSSQPLYNLLRREAEAELIPLCAANRISQIVWSPLAQGVLGGRYRTGTALPEGSRAATNQTDGAIDRLLRPELLEAVGRLKPLAAEARLTLSQFALAWVLRKPDIASAIVGASRPGQLEENAGAAGAEVDPALFEEAERILDPFARRQASKERGR